MKALFTSVLIAVLGTLGCGSRGRFTAAELFPVQAGQSWHMVNQFGDVTTWSVEAVPANSSCETDGGRMLGLRITKGMSSPDWKGPATPPQAQRWEERIHRLEERAAQLGIEPEFRAAAIRR